MFSIFHKLIAIAFCFILIQAGNAPFIKVNEIHSTHSQFQFNLILNQNRNTPIILVQYSQTKTENILRPIIQNTFYAQPDIAFAMFIDCRNFTHNMNKSLGICYQFDEYLKTYEPKDPDQDDSRKLDDTYFRFQFFSPNPTRIKEKGHLITKNHDSQNLRALNSNFNSQFLAKVVRNEIPDFVTYVEDQRDLEDFLQTNSEFRLSKGPKLLYFDQNLQSPLFLKKIAVSLDGWFKIAVSDSPKMVEQYKSKFQQLIIFEFNFQSGKYEYQRLSFQTDNALNSILNNKLVKSYTDIRKPRDILLDFEHKLTHIYNITNLKQINQLISHGRIILLQASNSAQEFNCPNLNTPRQLYQSMFNYVCFGRQNLADLLTGMQADTQKGWKDQVFFIDRSIRNTKLVQNVQNLYAELPKAPIRQTITTEKDSQICVQAAKASQRQPIIFYFIEKTHSKSLNLLRYFNSLEQINSLLYFCQIYLPTQDVKSTYQLNQNSIFTLTPPDQHGRSQKVEHTKMENFMALKMFLREIALTKIMRFYDQKVLKNELLQIKSAEELTDRCFSQKCIIGLIQTNTFHQETELSILKELQIEFSDENVKFYWIDGICHFQVGKQLKLAQKTSKLIEKSYLFSYNEKTYQYAVWKGSKYNKFWQKKDVFRWVKSLRNPANLGKLKFGIDFQNRKCIRQQKKPEKKEELKKPQKQAISTKRQQKPIQTQKSKPKEVNQDQL